MSFVEKSDNSPSLKLSKSDGKVEKGKAPSVPSDYHTSEIFISHYLYKHYIFMLWVGIGITLLGVIFCIFGIFTAGIISTITGCVQSFITGTIFKTLTTQSAEKERYYQRAFEEKLLDIICKQGSDVAQSQIEKFVDRCCRDKSDKKGT